MAYSQVGIVNMALGRIGVKRISSMAEDSEAAIAANSVWEYIRDEVLSAKDWRFAKTRVALAQNATTPVYGYDYAYTLPTDFLRLCLTKENDPSVYPSGAFAVAYLNGIIVFLERAYRFVIEALADGTLCLLTDYDNTTSDLYTAYIRKVADVSKWSPAFINAFANRFAAEISITRTESRPKFADMMTLYKDALRAADEQTASLDYVDDVGCYSWERAGR